MRACARARVCVCVCVCVRVWPCLIRRIFFLLAPLTTAFNPGSAVILFNLVAFSLFVVELKNWAPDSAENENGKQK